MKYDKEQIKKFNQYTIEDYNQSLGVEEIAKVNLVEKTDGSFIQIGIRPIIEDDMFIYENWHPSLPSIGMDVANGERDFLIKNILDNKEISRASIGKEELKEFAREIDFNESTILISNDFFVELSMSLMRRIKYENNKMILDFHHKLIFVPGGAMKNKIIMIEKDAILWEKKKFPNEFTEKDEKIDVRVVPAKQFGKADITIRSVNKIKHLDSDLIKILEVRKNLKGEG